jgi:hypothetical protein
LQQQTDKLTPSTVSRALMLYAVVLLATTALSWGVYRWTGGPFFRPFFSAEDQFKDLLNYAGKTAHLWHSSGSLGAGYPVFSYPPLSAVVWNLLLHSFHGHPLAPYLVAATFAVGAYGFLAFRAADLRPPLGLAAAAAIEITAVAGFPFWYAIDRGNLEALVWAICGAGICCFLRQRYRAAAVCIALAVCIKPFPVVFLALLLLRRRYREAILGVVVAGVLVLAGLFVIGPNPWKAYQDLKPGAAIYSSKYLETVRHPGEVRFAHSVLDGLKSAGILAKTRSLSPRRVEQQTMWIYERGRTWPAAVLLVRLYPAIAAMILVVLILSVRRAPSLNQVTMLGVAATLLPPNAGEYTLLNLYVPFGAFIVFLTREVAAGRLRLSRQVLLLVLVDYGLLFSPLSFLRIYAGDAKLLLLIGLAILFAYAPMPSAYFGDALDRTDIKRV